MVQSSEVKSDDNDVNLGQCYLQRDVDQISELRPNPKSHKILPWMVQVFSSDQILFPISPSSKQGPTFSARQVAFKQRQFEVSDATRSFGLCTAKLKCCNSPNILAQ